MWQRVLQVRTLVLNPEDDPVMWIKFANLCRKSDRMQLAEKTINSLMSPDRVRLITFSPGSLSSPFRPAAFATLSKGSVDASTPTRDIRASEIYVGPRGKGVKSQLPTAVRK